MWEFAYEKPHLSSKIQLKTWPLTLVEYQLSFSEVADLLHHCDKVHYFHWHFKSDIYDTHLFWFMQPFLSAANDRLKEKPSLGTRVWECVRMCVSENTNYEVYDLTDCWTTGVIVTVGWTCSLSHSQAVSVGWTEAQTHSYNSCDVSL